MQIIRSLALSAMAVCCSCAGGGEARDEAAARGMKAQDFPADPHDYFGAMDGNVRSRAEGGPVVALTLTAEEIKGRNTWMMWCGGNEGFWDWLANNSYGFMDLLKV